MSGITWAWNSLILARARLRARGYTVVSGCDFGLGSHRVKSPHTEQWLSCDFTSRALIEFEARLLPMTRQQEKVYRQILSK